MGQGTIIWSVWRKYYDYRNILGQYEVWLEKSYVRGRLAVAEAVSSDGSWCRECCEVEKRCFLWGFQQGQKLWGIRLKSWKVQQHRKRSHAGGPGTIRGYECWRPFYPTAACWKKEKGLQQAKNLILLVVLAAWACTQRASSCQHGWENEPILVSWKVVWRAR